MQLAATGVGNSKLRLVATQERGADGKLYRHGSAHHCHPSHPQATKGGVALRRGVAEGDGVYGHGKTLGGGGRIGASVVDAVGGQHHSIGIATGEGLNLATNVGLSGIAEHHPGHTATALQLLGQRVEVEGTVGTLGYR